MLFSLWAPVPYRATGDLDLLGFGENAPVAITAVFAEILATKVEDDGVIFRPDTLRAAPAREQDEYAGVRLDFVAELVWRAPCHACRHWIRRCDHAGPGRYGISFASGAAGTAS
nr:nucleotidyl transferase AbiEii/AbiGii toxin family protein [Phyllobacterium sp. IY22]